MIDLKEVLKLHEIAIEKFGGLKGVRDQNLLDSAVKRPFVTFDGEDLYQTAEEKACAALESIVKNHPFHDGNKRTGYLVFRLYLLREGYDIQATQEEKYDFVLKIAAGEMKYDEIVAWTKQKLVINS